MSKLEEGVKPKQEIVGLLPENQISHYPDFDLKLLTLLADFHHSAFYRGDTHLHIGGKQEIVGLLPENQILLFEAT
jgi:hypothetical protein